MRAPLASRAVAVVVAMVLAASGVGACLHPQSARAVEHCCAKRCHRQAAGNVARSCCAAHQAPAAKASFPGLRPPTGAALTAIIAPVPPIARASVGRGTSRVPAPPGRALFLRDCTLLL